MVNLRTLFSALLSLNCLGAAIAEEDEQVTKISIPVPLADGTPAEPVPEPAPIPFKVLTSHTKRVYVTEAPEMPDLPPVEGMINVTVQKVQDPGLPDPPLAPPLPNPIAEDSAAMEQMVEFQEPAGDTSMIMLSATVYNHSRTLLTISPNGITEGQISAWSNVDFNHFSGFSTFRVTEANGAEHDVALLMGIGNEEAVAPDGEQPEMPKLPDLAAGGPSFSVVEGDSQGEAMKILTQLHALYQKEGANLETAFHAREKAHAERKAYLLANPPKPDDIVIRFMEKDPSKAK